MNKKLIGATLAAAAALTFTAAPISSALAEGNESGVKCFGVNACQGKAACKTAKNDCQGKNSCKGQGYVMKESKDDCTKAGGKTTES